MPTSSILTDGFLAHYLCQAVICAFIATLLTTLSRLQPTGLMRWWSVAWAALAVYIGSAGLSLYFVLQGYEETHWTRIATSVLALSSAGVQTFALCAGWMAERNKTNNFSRRRLFTTLACALILGTLATLVLHHYADSRARFVIKVSLRGGLIGCVYLWIGAAILRRTSLIRLIRIWLGLGLVAFGIKHVHHAYLTYFHEGLASYNAEYLLQFVDLALHVVIASPMLLWVCLRFADRSAAQRRELRRRAAMLEEQDVRLSRRQRMSTVGRMAAGVAHDFNNVLSVIQSWADILRHDSQLDELGREGIEEIDAAAKQAGDISQKLMLFGGKQVLKQTLIDVRDVVQEAARLTPQLAGRRFETDLPDDLPMIRGDRALLLTSLQNLLINAVDATDKGGLVSIAVRGLRVAGEQAKQLEIAAGDYVQFTVTDDGCGIADEVLPKIFEPFFTTKSHGNGLGMSSVHGFFCQSRGALRVQSREGHGASFYAWLPVATEAADSADSPPIDLPTVAIARPNPVGEARTVMVVDDEPTIAWHATRVLQRAGFEVVHHTSAIQALAHARELGDRLSILVTDVRMPERSGQELALEIAASQPHLKVVFVTGFADDVDVGALPLQATPSLLQKPVTSEALLEAVRAQEHRPAPASHSET